MINFKKWAAAAGAVTALALASAPAQADAYDNYYGEVFLTAASFCPVDTVEAAGQYLSTSTYAPLFALLGTTYGGNGYSNFRLPDLQGRIPTHHGTGPGLYPQYVGDIGGLEEIYIDYEDMAPHSHTLNSADEAPNSLLPTGNKLASGIVPPNRATTNQTMATQFSPEATGITGSQTPVQNMQPTLALRYCIVTDGLWPPMP